MTTASVNSTNPVSDLEPAPPETKEYSRLKHYAIFASIALHLTFVIIAALFIGPALGPVLKQHLGENRWLNLIVVGFFFAAALELITLPLDFWSGYILEHRYQ